VYWQNLREEPLVFINGHPFVVRESDKPFSNLEYTGRCHAAPLVVKIGQWASEGRGFWPHHPLTHTAFCHRN